LESASMSAPEHFRLLNWNEIVTRGDYVGNDRQEIEPWVGPAGFQAGTFVKPIFRCDDGNCAKPTLE
jgi:hypothetical protein